MCCCWGSTGEERGWGVGCGGVFLPQSFTHVVREGAPLGEGLLVGLDDALEYLTSINTGAGPRTVSGQSSGTRTWT